MSVSHKIVLGAGAVYYVLGLAYVGVVKLSVSSDYGAELRSLGAAGSLVALFAVAFVASEGLLRPRRSAVARTVPPAWTYAIAIVVLDLAALFGALQVGLDGLALSREYGRAAGQWLQIINLHLPAALLAAIVLVRHRGAGKAARLIAFTAVALSLAIGLAEGRRAALAIPMVFVGLLVVTHRGIGTGRRLAWLLLGGVVAVAGVVFATSMRTGATGSEIGGALASRLFSPAWILTSVTGTGMQFDPETVLQIGRRLGGALFITEYRPRTNDFGVALGVLDSRNYIVGINFGIVAEAYLWGGIVGVLLWAVMLERAIAMVTRFASHPAMEGPLVIGLLAAHGLQMEIPYTIVALLKGGVLIWLGAGALRGLELFVMGALRGGGALWTKEERNDGGEGVYGTDPSGLFRQHHSEGTC